MSLELDKRQRAMLREMGIRVWQPVATAEPEPEPRLEPRPEPRPKPELKPEPATAQNATKVTANSPTSARAESAFDTKTPLRTPAAAARPPKVAPALPPENDRAESRPHNRPDTGTAVWSLGEAQVLYAQAAALADGSSKGARWLVLAEAPASALQAQAFNPFEGEAGKLLDNMLRAARLNKAGAVLLAPLVRHSAADPAAASLQSALPELIDLARPDVVLVMGRLGAQAILQSGEPFGKLRGQVHELHGIKTIVTHDAAYLLRTPLDKAKAWDDLCLAMHVVQEHAGH